MRQETRTGGMPRQSGLRKLVVSPPSPLLAKLLTSDRADRASLRAALEARKNGAHHGPDVGRPALDRCADRRPKLLVAHLWWLIHLEQRDLGALLFGQIVPLHRGVHFDRFAAALDAAANPIEYLVIVGISTKLDPPVLHVGENGAVQQRSSLVLRFSRGVHVLLQSREEVCHYAVRLRRVLRCAAFIFRFLRSLGFS